MSVVGISVPHEEQVMSRLARAIPFSNRATDKRMCEGDISGGNKLEVATRELYSWSRNFTARLITKDVSLVSTASEAGVGGGRA